MAAKKKKIKASGRFGAGYGTRVRKRLNVVESAQRKRQACPFCKKLGVKRVAVGIWNCKKCDKRFAHNAYSLSS